jgi:hypothetical protein
MSAEGGPARARRMAVVGALIAVTVAARYVQRPTSNSKGRPTLCTNVGRGKTARSAVTKRTQRPPFVIFVAASLRGISCYDQAHKEFLDAIPKG